MSDYRPEIETLDEWNEAIAACGCCPMPACPVPTKVCESITGYITSTGHRNPADTVWKRYKKQGTLYTLADAGSASGIGPSGNVIIQRTWDASGSEFVGTYYEHLYTGGIGVGEGCPSWPNGSQFLCEASGSSTVSSFDEFVWSLDGIEFNYPYGKSSEVVSTISPAAGLETVAHAAWVALYTDEAGWQAAHDAWQAAADAYATWVTDRDNWLAEDPERNPEDFPDPEPPLPGNEPEAEPEEEFYGDCCWKITHESTIFAHYFAYESDGSSAAPPADNEAVQAWIDGGSIGNPPAPGTGSLIEYFCSPSSPLSSLYYEGDGAITEETGYFEPQSYAAWLAEVSALLDAEMPGVDAECKGVLCISEYQATAPATVTSTAILEKTSSRFRWVIPDTWTGSYFKLTWDVVFFPTTEDPVAVATDQTWEWSGPGDPEDAATWKSGWYDIFVPAEAGESRVVNIRFECYGPTPYGNKPQVTGEAVDIPPP